MKFKVKTELHRNNVVHKPGSTVELDAKEAASMPWALEALPAEPPKQEPKDDDKGRK